jgi:hypothetical protein
MYSKSWIAIPEGVSMLPLKNKDTTYRLRIPNGERISTAVFWKADKERSKYPDQEQVVLQVFPRSSDNSPIQFPSLYVWILRWMLAHKMDLDLSMTTDNHHFTYHTIRYMPFKDTPEETESVIEEAGDETPPSTPAPPSTPVGGPIPSPPLEMPREPKTTPFPATINTILDDLTLLQGSLIRAKRSLLKIHPLNQGAYLNVLNSMDTLNDIRKNIIKYDS